MRLSWYGTASVMLESGGCRLLFDPFLGMPLDYSQEGREALSAVYRSADAVLVTHGHFDHIYDIPSLYLGLNTPIYATKTPVETLKNNGVKSEKLHLIKPGDKLSISPFNVTVYQGRHCEFDTGVVLKTVFKADTVKNPNRLLELLRLNEEYPENGETLFYEIEAEGKRVQLTGSMGLDDSTDYPVGADALILPFQGTSRPIMTVAPMLARLKPKSVYLDHYDDAFPPLSSQIDTTELENRLTAHGKKCEGMKYNKVYEI